MECWGQFIQQGMYSETNFHQSSLIFHGLFSLGFSISTPVLILAPFIFCNHSQSFITLSRRVCSLEVSVYPLDPAWGHENSCDSILKVKICLHTGTHEREEKLRLHVGEGECQFDAQRLEVSGLCRQFTLSWFDLGCSHLKLKITT